MIALRENLRIALRALHANWFRGILTALGIVIGVASVIAVNAVSAGAGKEVTDSINRLGANVVLVDGEFINIGQGQSATERTITSQDVTAIRQLPMVQDVARYQDMESLSVSAGRYQATTFLLGVTSSYANLFNQSAQSGRLISPTDVSFGRSVMVLGQATKDKLFPGQNPIGKTVRVGSHEFEVIGVQDRKGKLAGENLDARVFVPLPVVLRVILGGVNTHSVAVKVRSEADIEPVQDRIATILRRQHNLPPSYADDFSTEDQAETVKEAQRATSTFRNLTFALGGISMLVGGIGIMNMMLVSVRERTREIGIRKSVGATPRLVQSQFLIEAAVLSALAGVGGVVLGVASTRWIGSALGWQTLVVPPSVATAFLLAIVVGLFFGFYPARRASRLDPIMAIHTD